MNKYHKIQTVFKRNPDNRHKTLLHGEFSLPEFEYLKDNTWVFTEKVDGCLHYQQTVSTDDGDIYIGKIVEHKLPVKILSYNEQTGKMEFKPIIHFHKEKRVRDFVCVEVESRLRGNKHKHIVCTDNHKFYSDGQWIDAKNLSHGQNVSHLSKCLPQELKQILLGMLLGDASIYRPSELTRGFAFLHSIEQSDYFEYKKTLFGNLFKENAKTKGGYPGSKEQRRGCSIVNRTISDLILNNCEINKKKYITDNWVNNITPLSLAFWYMDDGSCNFNENQRPRISLATNGFSKNEVNKLSNMLFQKFNIKSTVADYKGWMIIINADSSEIFFSLIFPYIHDSMKYKLPKKYHKFNNVLQDKTFDLLQDIIDSKVISVSKNLPISKQKQQTYQYDLTVKDNSNYFTTQILVHNTNTRLMYRNGITTFNGKTDAAQLPATLVQFLNDAFIANAHMDEVFGQAEVCLYGEGYGAGIQKGGKYRQDQSFVLFDIKINGWWLEREDVADIAHKLNINVVPIIGEGTLADMVELAKTGFHSQWGEFAAEGIVARPKVELKSRNGNRIITKIKYKDFQKEGE